MARPLSRSTNVAATFPHSEAASGHDGNRVGGAAIDLHKRNQALAVFTARVFDPQLLKPKHRQTRAEHLPGAQVSVCLFSFAKVGIDVGRMLTGNADDLRRTTYDHFTTDSKENP
jgi:hypothetical protein